MPYDDEALYNSIVETLRGMRLVQKSIYGQASWRKAVKVSICASGLLTFTSHLTITHRTLV